MNDARRQLVYINKNGQSYHATELASKVPEAAKSAKLDLNEVLGLFRALGNQLASMPMQSSYAVDQASRVALGEQEGEHEAHRVAHRSARAKVNNIHDRLFHLTLVLLHRSLKR